MTTCGGITRTFREYQHNLDASEQTNTFAGDIVAGRSFDDCDPITGHELLSHTVTWKGESDLSALAGRPVPTS